MNYLSQRDQATRFYYFPILYLTRPPLPMADRWVVSGRRTSRRPTVTSRSSQIGYAPTG